MDNYIYFLREIIDKNKIYEFDKYKDNKENIDRFIDLFSKNIEKKYPRKIYKTLRYLVVDQIYFVLREEGIPENIAQAIFSVAFHQNTYYFMMEKVLTLEQAAIIKNNIHLLNSKNSEGIKDLYMEALWDLDTELDFTFIDIKKRVENDIYFKYEQINKLYCKMWFISFYKIDE